MGCFVLFGFFSSPLNYARSCFCGQRRTKEQKTASLPAISKLVFSCQFCAPRSLVLLSDFCFPLFSLFFLLAQTLEQTVVLVLTLKHTLVFPTLSSLCFLLLFFTLALTLAVLRLGFIHRLPSFQCTSLESFQRSRSVLKSVCHSLCGFSESSGFVKVLLFYFIVLLMKQSSCSGNFQLTLSLQVLRNLHST